MMMEQSDLNLFSAYGEEILQQWQELCHMLQYSLCLMTNTNVYLEFQIHQMELRVHGRLFCCRVYNRKLSILNISMISIIKKNVY